MRTRVKVPPAPFSAFFAEGGAFFVDKRADLRIIGSVALENGARMGYNVGMEFQDIVIGGGASGMACAVMLARKGRKVVVLEAQDRTLKKLLATGNGRCNLSNAAVSPDRYNAPDFVRYALESFDGEKVSRFFLSVGLLLREEEGRIYPYSLNAGSVVNALLRAAKAAGVTLAESAKVEKIIRREKFEVYAAGKKYVAQNVVFAAGSNATSGRDSLSLLKFFGHDVTPRYASISYIPCSCVRGASGVRARAALSLICDGRTVFSGEGELLFKDNALSGILAFEASSRYARALRQGKTCTGEIDFAPDRTREDLEGFFSSLDCDCEQALCGIVHRALAAAIVKKAGAKGGARLNAGLLARTVKGYALTFDGACDVKNAQVVCGGLELSSFDPQTMRSRLVPGLYATGEALDVDGDCGGFNLHWAWASAYTAAKAIVGDNDD